MKCPICEEKMDLEYVQDGCENYLILVYKCARCPIKINWTINERLLNEVYRNSQ